MAPPTQLGIGLSLARGIVRGGLDADAAAYIAAVESALSSSISGDQKNAINDFIKTGKSDGWYSSIKRLYLPIWADAAANAIDMISLTSGTFPVPSGVDNSNVGYVQGDGSTGYFEASGTFSGDGLTTSNGMMFLARKNIPANTTGAIGGTSPGRTLILPQLGGKMRSDWGDNTTNFWTSTGTNDNIAGVFTTTRNETSIIHAIRTSTGVSRQSANRPVTGAIYSGDVKVMSIAAFFDTAHYLAFGWGAAMSDARTDSFTLALKDLWETASGLTLP